MMPSPVADFCWLLGLVVLTAVLTVAVCRARRSESGRKVSAVLREAVWVAVALFHGSWLGALLVFVVAGPMGLVLSRNFAFGLSSLSVGLLAAAALLAMIIASIREGARPPHLICCVLAVISLQALGLFLSGVSTCWMFVYR